MHSRFEAGAEEIKYFVFFFILRDPFRFFCGPFWRLISKIWQKSTRHKLCREKCFSEVAIVAVQGAFRFKRLKRLFRTKSSSRSVRFKIRRGNSNAAFTRQTQYWCFENARKNFSFGQGLACFNWIRIQLLVPLVPFLPTLEWKKSLFTGDTAD